MGIYLINGDFDFPALMEVTDQGQYVGRLPVWIQQRGAQAMAFAVSRSVRVINGVLDDPNQETFTSLPASLLPLSAASANRPYVHQCGRARNNECLIHTGTQLASGERRCRLAHCGADRKRRHWPVCPERLQPCHQWPSSASRTEMRQASVP